jgi:urease accessory protein
MRNGAPFVFSNLMTLQGLDEIVGWLKKYALLENIEEPNLVR